MANTVTVNPQQSMLDIAMQTAGGPDAVFDLVKKNGIGITDPLSAGQVLQTVDPVDKAVSDYYTAGSFRPANAVTQDGIGYDIIESTLVVN